jgi:hypothetical protein
MKTRKMNLIMLAITVFIFATVPAMGQNKSVADTTKQDTVIYTCTMHPEIQSSQPGTCPKCGMALVKKSEASEKQHKKHKMQMMHPMMNEMSGMENMDENTSAEKNKVTNDSTQKEAFFYTCSMHPEIQSSQPGACPKCGMALIKKSTVPGKKEKSHKMSSMGMGIGMGIMMAVMLIFLIRR